MPRLSSVVKLTPLLAAGMFTSKGADVKLFFSFEEEAERFRKGCDKNNGVTVSYKDGDMHGMPSAITTDPAEVRCSVQQLSPDPVHTFLLSPRPLPART